MAQRLLNVQQFSSQGPADPFQHVQEPEDQLTQGSDGIPRLSFRILGRILCASQQSPGLSGGLCPALPVKEVHSFQHKGS